MQEQITYFWQVIIHTLVQALLILALIGLVFALVYAMEHWIKARQKVMKYRIGYSRAINDAINDVNKLYEEWESDDPLSDIPNQKIIIQRLERLKYVNKRNIQH